MCSPSTICSHITVILVVSVINVNYNEFKQYYLITLLIKIPLQNNLARGYDRLFQGKTSPEVILSCRLEILAQSLQGNSSYYKVRILRPLWTL